LKWTPAGWHYFSKVKSITRPALALCMLSMIGNARSSGLIVEKEPSRSTSVYKVVPFSTEGVSTAFESYFTDKNGNALRVNDDLIVKIVRFPDVRNLTDQSALASLQAKQAELQDIARKLPITRPYTASQMAAIQSNIARFQSGERMLNGKWLTGPEYQKFKADAAAAQSAAKAEREQRIAEQQAAEKAAQESRIAEQKALEKKRAEEQKAKEVERERKEQEATADLKRANEEFEASEKRAAESYRSATKGVLFGQVFVSTKGGESIKLGAVQVSLFARDPINILLAGLKAYADAKIELSHESSAVAKTAMEQAEVAEQIASDAYVKSIASGEYKAARQTSDQARKAADTARDQYFSKTRDESVYYSGDFYFSYLRSPLQTAETDADGKFVIEVPRTGSFVIAARDRRSLWDTSEKYYWLQPVSLEGQQQRVQNLSNTNLSSATGTSSLVLTKD
jgi:hypothetical protein